MKNQSNTTIKIGTESTTTNNTSAVRNLSEQIITTRLNKTYKLIERKSLNASYWDARSQKLAKTVTQNVAGEFEVTGKKIAEEVLKKAASKLGVNVNLATTPLLLFKTAVNYAIFGSAIDVSNVGPNMRLGKYDDIRSDLDRLRQNTKDIRQADSFSRKRELFKERKQILKSLYKKLPGYLDTVHGNIVSNPVYGISFFDAAGLHWNLGRSSYSTIRWHTEILRSHIVMDYQYTVSWLQNESRAVYLANETGRDMPRHQLDFSTQSSRFYDTIDAPGDYTIYEIKVSKALAGSDKNLQVRITGGDPQNISATISRSKPAPSNIGGSGTFQTTSDSLLNITRGVESGTYYVAVTSKNNKSQFYKLETTVYKPDLIPLIDLDHAAPPLSVSESGSNGGSSSDSGSTTVADPDPTIRCQCITPTEDGFLVSVRVTNKGGPSRWQSIAVSMPKITNNSSVKIIDTNLDYAQIYNGTVGAAYGNKTINTSYLLIEGAVTDWQSGENYYLNIEVTPPREGTYQIHAKSVARADGVWYSDPALGQTGTIDQQEEFVYNKTFTYIKRHERPKWSWHTIGSDPRHTGYNDAVAAPSHNISQQWRSVLDAPADSAPIVTNDRIFVTTTNNTLYGINRSSGSVVWRYYASNNFHGSPTYNEGALFISTRKEIKILNAKTGSELCDCSFRMGDKDASTPIVNKGLVYTTTVVGDRYDKNDGAVYAFDVASRRTQWRKKFGDEHITAPVAVEGTTVYVATKKGNLYALDRLTGTRRWKASLGSTFVHSATVSDGRVYIGDTHGRVYAVDVTDGRLLWEYNTGQRIRGSVATDDNRVYIPAGDQLVALDASTGSWQWSYQADGELTTAPSVANDTVYVGSKSGQRVYGIDANDGSERFSYYTSKVRTPPTVINNTLIFGARSSLYSLGGESGVPTARFSVDPITPNPGDSVTLNASMTTDPDGAIKNYSWDINHDGTFERTGQQIMQSFTHPGQRLVTLRVTDSENATDTITRRLLIRSAVSDWNTQYSDRQFTGSLTETRGPTHDLGVDWRFVTGGSVAQTPTVVNNTLYLPSTDNKLYALNRSSGGTIWSFKTASTPRAPTVNDGVAYVTTSNNRVYAVDLEGGQLRWTFNTGDKRISQAVVYQDTVYVTTIVGDRYDKNDGGIYAIDTETGQLKWQSRFGDEQIVSPPVVTSTTIYVATKAGSVRAVDRLTGSNRWKQSLGGSFKTAPALADGRLYLGSTNGLVYALDATDGSKQWDYHTGIGIHHSIAVDKNRVYVTVGQRLQAFSKGGDWVWSYKADAQLTTAPVVANGTVYVGSKPAQRVYGVDTADGSERFSYYTSKVRSGLALVNTTLYFGARSSLYAITGETNAPVAQFSASSTSITAGDTVTFDASKSIDPGGTITAYHWDIDNDGVFEYSNKQTTKTFTQPGERLVTLRVTDKSGANDTTTRLIRVRATADDPDWTTTGFNLKRTRFVSNTLGPTHGMAVDWRFVTGGSVAQTPTVVNNTLYLPGTNNQLYVLNSSSGNQRWSVELPATPKSPTVKDGVAYVAASNNRVYAVDLEGGQLRWTFNTGDKRISQAVVYQNTVYVTTIVGDRYDKNDGGIYAIDTETGQLKWQNRFSDEQIVSPPIVTSTTIYVATKAGSVRAVDRLTGSNRWKQSLGGSFKAAPALADGRLYLGSTNGLVYALDATDGSKQWDYHTGVGIHHSVAVDDNKVYITTGQRLQAFSKGGDWVWSHKADSQLTTAPVVANGTVYVGSKPAQRVYGIDALDGSERWNYYTSKVRSGLALINTTLYFGARDSLYALAGQTGAPTAQFSISPKSPTAGDTVTLDATATTDPSGQISAYHWDIDGDGQLELTGKTVTTEFNTSGTHVISLYVNASGTRDSNTRRLIIPSDRSGWATVNKDRQHTAYAGDTLGLTHNVRVDWRFVTGGSVAQTPTIVNNTVYVSSTNNRLHVLDRSDGTEHWSVELPATPKSPTVKDGVAYVAASNNRVYAIDLEGGQLRWTFNTGDKRISQAVVYQDTVYVTTIVGDRYDKNDGGIYAIDTETGQLKWQNRFSDEQIVSPPTVTSTTVYVATKAGSVRAVDRLTGSNRWKQSLGGSFRAAPALADGRLYLGSTNGRVYALDANDGDTRWQIDTGAPIRYSVSVAPDRVYASSGDSLVAIERKRGVQVWRSTIGKRLSTAPVVANGTVYVGSKRAQRVYGIDALDGSERWNYYTSRVRSGLALINTTLYFGARSSLYALSGATGAPSAGFTYTPKTPRRGESIQFNASKTYDIDGSITRYEWDFDDDGLIEATGLTANYTFNAVGNYSVTLHATDDDGIVGTSSSIVHIPDTIDPSPAINASRTVVDVGSTVRFNASGSTDNVRVDTIEWRIDDGSYDHSGTVFTHTFSTAGTYTVVVRVTDPAGNAQTRFVTVTVVEKSSPDVTANRTIHGGVRPGSTVNVTVRITPNESIDGLTVRESLPEDVSLLRQSSPSATFKNTSNRWLWLNTTAGNEYVVNYTLAVSSNASFADPHNISGAVSGYAVTPAEISGEQEIEVVTCAERVVAGPDRVISLAEIQRAAHWWANTTPIPNTRGEVLSLREIQQFVHAWVEGKHVDCGSSSITTSTMTMASGLPDDEDLNLTHSVDRNTTRPNGSVVITTTIDANGYSAPALDLNLPPGWAVQKQVVGSGEFRPAETQWLWLQETNITVRYIVSVPANASSDGYAIRVQASGVDTDAGVSRTTTATETVQVIKPGDVNGDNRVTSGDATLLKRHIIGLSTSNIDSVAADVNGDGHLTSYDVTLILRKVIGLA